MHLRKTNNKKNMFIILSVGFPDNFRFVSRKGVRPGMLRHWEGSLLFKHSFLKYLHITSRIVDSQLARDLNETPRVSFSFPCPLGFPWLSVLPQFSIVSEHGPVSSGFVQENKTQEA